MKKIYLHHNDFDYLAPNGRQHMIGMCASRFSSDARHWAFDGQRHRINGPQAIEPHSSIREIFLIYNRSIKLNISTLVI